MSKKRKFDEVDSDGEEASQGSDALSQLSQQGMESKRAKLAYSRKPVNRGSWRRLRAFCSNWVGYLFTTDNYPTDVPRKPAGTSGKEIRLEFRDTAPIRFTAYDVTTLKNEILIFGRGKEEEDRFINIYDRSNLIEAKAVIPLENTYAVRIAACNVSNCVYVLAAEPESLSVMRLTKDDHQFNISPWISNLPRAYSSLTVSAIGNIVLSLQMYQAPAEIRVYNASGSVLHRVVLSTNVYGFRYVDNVMQKTNGNIVVQSLNLPTGQDMMELDPTGRIVYQYNSSIPLDFIDASFVDVYDRTFVCYQSRIDVLDQEFHQLEVALARPDTRGEGGYHDKWRYNSEGHEVVRVLADENFQNGVLSIFHISEK